jgi:hypothetical protein
VPARAARRRGSLARRSAQLEQLVALRAAVLVDRHDLAPLATAAVVPSGYGRGPSRLHGMVWSGRCARVGRSQRPALSRSHRARGCGAAWLARMTGGYAVSVPPSTGRYHLGSSGPISGPPRQPSVTPWPAPCRASGLQRWLQSQSPGAGLELRSGPSWSVPPNDGSGCSAPTSDDRPSRFKGVPTSRSRRVCDQGVIAEPPHRQVLGRLVDNEGELFGVTFAAARFTLPITDASVRKWISRAGRHGRAG